MNRILTPIFILTGICTLLACRESLSENEIRFNQITDRVQKHAPASKSECMIAFASEMLDTKYVAGTLEGDTEELIIHFDKTDCILFVEAATAFSQTYRHDSTDFGDYAGTIKKLRYRNGILTDYTSRIHYTSEWLKQAEENGYLKEMTPDICALLDVGTYDENISFMSRNSEKYPMLKKHPEMLPTIRATENRLNQDIYHVIPKGRIPDAEEQIKDGDIIAFNSSIQGLDISHVGIAIRIEGRLTFIHASSAKGKVIIQPGTLADYCMKNRSCDGIRVARVI